MIADKLLARLRSAVGYVPSVWSLVRILCFTVVGLLMASLAFAYHPGALTNYWNRVGGTNHSHVVSLELGDTRGYKPVAPSNSYRIAWVGGSEILGVKPGHPSVIPGLVNNRIRSVDGKRARTDIYFQDAMRLEDELSSLHRALASNPDLVVVSLNPAWVLNDLAVQQWGYLDGLLARGSILHPGSWPVAASLLSPGDVGWKGMSMLFSSIDDRLYWGTTLADKTSGISFLHKVSGASEAAPTGLGALGLRRPVDFWQQHYAGVPPTASHDTKQLALLGRGVQSRSSFNQRLLQDMFAAVRQAGVKAYFYVPAISPRLYAMPKGKHYIDELRAQLTAATKGQTTSRVLFDPQGLQDRVAPAAYQDIVHKLDPVPEVNVLTKDLCHLIAQGGHRTGCEKR